MAQRKMFWWLGKALCRVFSYSSRGARLCSKVDTVGRLNQTDVNVFCAALMIAILKYAAGRTRF